MTQIPVFLHIVMPDPTNGSTCRWGTFTYDPSLYIFTSEITILLDFFIDYSSKVVRSVHHKKRYTRRQLGSGKTLSKDQFYHVSTQVPYHLGLTVVRIIYHGRSTPWRVPVRC